MKTALMTLLLLALAATCDARISAVVIWCGAAVVALPIVIVTVPPRSRYHAPVGGGDDY